MSWTADTLEKAFSRINLEETEKKVKERLLDLTGFNSLSAEEKEAVIAVIRRRGSR